MLKNLGARAVVLTGYKAAISYFGLPAAESAMSLDVTLTPNGEHRILLYTLLPCPDEPRECRFPEGPSWHIVLAGRDGGSAAFTATIDLALPAVAGSAIVQHEQVIVTRRAPAVGPDAGRIPARFSAGMILVPASLNGQDLTLLFDTGAQVCVLRPDAARRLRLTAPADAPTFPLMSFGALLGGTLVRLPPLRVGDYVVEHLTAAIATLVDLPVPIDGVLGANFMEAFRVGIDHRAKELRLEPAR